MRILYTHSTNLQGMENEHIRKERQNGDFIKICGSGCIGHLFVPRIHNKTQYIIYSKQIHTAYYGGDRNDIKCMDQWMDFFTPNSTWGIGEWSCKYRNLRNDPEYLAGGYDTE